MSIILKTIAALITMLVVWIMGYYQAVKDSVLVGFQHDQNNNIYWFWYSLETMSSETRSGILIGLISLALIMYLSSIQMRANWPNMQFPWALSKQRLSDGPVK